MITLHPLDRGAGARVAHIAVPPDQRRFARGVAYALAAPASTDLHEIRRDDAVVGLFRIDRAYARAFPFAAPGDLGLRGLIVDAPEQGRGTGSAAVAALGRYLPPLYPDARWLWLTVNFANPAARHICRKAGFTETGEIWRGGRAGPAHVMRLAL